MARVGLRVVGELAVQEHDQRAVLFDGAGLPEVRKHRALGITGSLLEMTGSLATDGNRLRFPARVPHPGAGPLVVGLHRSSGSVH